MKLRVIIALIFMFILMQLTGCAFHRHRYSQANDGVPSFYIDETTIPDAVPRAEPYSRYGNPKSYTANGRRYYVKKTSLGYDEKGTASWYGTKFHNHRTSSGDRYDVCGMTAAHKTLPIPCYARVTNLKNGKQVIVKINDRGPFRENRIIDLSFVAAKKLGIYPRGTGLVRVTTITSKTPTPTAPSRDPSRIYLQIGAFASREKAEILAKKIQEYTKKPIRVKSGSSQDLTLYRVQIGPLSSASDSDYLRNELSRANLGNAIPVVD